MRQDTSPIEYTVTSRGRPIGTTTLSWVRTDDVRRAGWFFPNEHGGGAMEVVGAVLPATMGASPRRRCDDELPSITPQELVTTTEWADCAEALHRVGALDLELRCADGTVVATEWIGIQDTKQRLALADEADERWEQMLDSEPWNRDREDQEQHLFDLMQEVESDAEELFGIGERWTDDDGEWTPEEEVELPRYQISLELAVPGAIP